MADTGTRRMNQGTPTTDQGHLSKTPSCVICQRRKVKCDRKDPCSACTRHGEECVYRPHLPPRRRKKPRRDETPKQSGGPSETTERLHRTLSSQPDKPVSQDFARDGTITPSRSQPGVMVTGGGKSVYLDNDLWTEFSNELPAPEVLRDLSDSDTSHSAQDSDDEASLLLESKRRKMTTRHPPPLQVFKFWQVYIENANPVIKILHAASTQQRILAAVEDFSRISKPFEALLFSLYCISVVSLKPEDVQKMFGESKATLLSRYRRGARLAFVNAGILRTSNIDVLKAFVLYLLAMRAFSDPYSIWTLCGVAVRIAQRIGLHRDGSRHGLSVFETEMRRRLWVQLKILDATAALSSGVKSQLSYLEADVLPPSNVNDSDLDPRMTQWPQEHHGATEMIFCLARSEFGKWLARWAKARGAHGTDWSFITSPSMSPKERDEAIDELSDTLGQGFLRHCDKNIPLHYLTATFIQSVVCQMRFVAHHPRQYGAADRHLSGADKDKIFNICIRNAANFDKIRTDDMTRPFSWHVENHLPWDALIYVLYELRHRVDGSQEAWRLIDSICGRHYQEMGNKAKTSLHSAIQRLILSSWKAHKEERLRLGRPALPCPHVVRMLDGVDGLEERPPDQLGSNLPLEMVAHGAAQNRPMDGDPTSHDLEQPSFFDGCDFSPIDWGQWDSLLEQIEQPDANDGSLFLDDG